MWWSRKKATLDPGGIADQISDKVSEVLDSGNQAAEEAYSEVCETSNALVERASKALEAVRARSSGTQAASFEVAVEDDAPADVQEGEAPAVVQEDGEKPSGHVLRNAVFSTLVVGGAAVIGSLATDTSSPWYKRLSKPEWQPAPEVFPVAWTSLYVLTAVASTRTLSRLRRAGLREEEGRYRRALVANMAMNAAWPVVFFQRKELGAAALTAGALAVSSGSLVRRARPAGRQCQLALTPYFLWSSFATGLSSELWLSNR